MTEPDYVAINREGWTQANAEYTDRQAQRRLGAGRRSPGASGRMPESELQVLRDVTGKDVVELGCGTAYFGAWLKRAGARRVVGVDVTPAQLEHRAARCRRSSGSGSRSSRRTPRTCRCRTTSFDLAFSEYGASIWCDP